MSNDTPKSATQSQDPTKKMKATTKRGIYKLPSGRFLARVRASGVMVSDTFNKLAEADAWKRRVEDGLKSGEMVVRNRQVKTLTEWAELENADNPHTLKNLIELFERHPGCKVKPSYLKALKADMGDKRVTGLTRSDVVHWLDTRCDGLAPATRNRYLSAISSVVKFGLERDWLETNPITGIKKLTENNARERVITQDEQVKLQKACDDLDPALGVIFSLLMATGARQGEIANLRWRDVDLNKMTVHLGASKTKTKQARTLHVAGKAADRLREWCKVTPMDRDTLVFPTSVGTPYEITKQFAIAAKACGLDRTSVGKDEAVTPHICRHTWATRTAGLNGISVAVLCQLAGWTSWAMASRYVHLMGDQSAALMAQLAEVHG